MITCFEDIADQGQLRGPPLAPHQEGQRRRGHGRVVPWRAGLHRRLPIGPHPRDHDEEGAGRPARRSAGHRSRPVGTSGSSTASETSPRRPRTRSGSGTSASSSTTRPASRRAATMSASSPRGSTRSWTSRQPAASWAGRAPWRQSGAGDLGGQARGARRNPGARDNQDERAASIRMRMRRGWADGERA